MSGGSLAQRLAALTTPTPQAVRDPEESPWDKNLPVPEASVAREHLEPVGRSTLRTLAEPSRPVAASYSGARVSRADWGLPERPDSDDEMRLAESDSEEGEKSVDDESSAMEVDEIFASHEEPEEEHVAVPLTSTARVEAEMARAKAAQEQYNFWTSLLQIRLALQTPLQLSNQLPSGVEDEEAVNEAFGLLNDIHELQTSLRLPSENGEKEDEYLADEELPRNLDELWEQLQADQATVEEHARAVIDTWHSRTHYAKKEGSLQSLNLSAPAQLDALEKAPAFEKIVQRALKEDDGVVYYDDAEFHDALVREFVQSSGPAVMDGSDPIALSQEYLRLRRVRQRQQRAKQAKVDRKASKGRKIRHEEIPQLAVFMAPQPSVYPELNSTRAEQLRSSLLGMNITDGKS